MAGTTIHVAPVGGDFTTIQAALNAAQPGDVILVDTAVYNEQIIFPRNGTPSQPILLKASPNHSPILDGTGFSTGNMVLMENRSWVEIQGFEIRNLTGIVDGSGVRVLGAGSGIRIRDCVIHNILGTHAMGITVYGTEPESMNDLIIERVLIRDCEPAQSEALTLNGNVENFQVLHCEVRDVNSIGIDFIGGETSINPDPNKVARNGICRGNLVIRARSNYEGGYGAGIYVDGGRDIVLEHNRVTQSDLGIEIGAENSAVDAYNIVVRGNLVYRNDKAGMVFGGYSAGVGRTRDSYFINNTFYDNDTLGEGLGELWIQFAHDNFIFSNIFFAGDQNILVYSEQGNVNNQLNNNLWFSTGSPDNASWVWAGSEYLGLSALQNGTGQEADGIWDDPMFTAAASEDFHIGSESPAIDMGSPLPLASQIGAFDIDNQPRVFNGRVDIGADEINNPALTCIFANFPLWPDNMGTECNGDQALNILDFVAMFNLTCVCQFPL